MSFLEVVDISSDEENNSVLEDVKPHVLLIPEQEQFNTANRRNPTTYASQPKAEPHDQGGSIIAISSNSESARRQGVLPNELGLASNCFHSVPKLCRQFWKAGEYEVQRTSENVAGGGRNHLRVNPKFLHSNATSHKWAFGAVAELVDNAVDEIQNGATFVKIDRVSDLKNGDAALLIQDDGSGMDPNSLRQCMSFGFSDKNSTSSIGQYGNGFKTSTMRLGADVIVFSRCSTKRTQSVGLLSYTFLRQTGYNDVVVPMLDYEFDPSSAVCRRILLHGDKSFSSNLAAILTWSPFGSEDNLLKQFDDIGYHGTKILVFNLWYSDDGVLELDFDSEESDIMISGAEKSVNIHKKSTRMHIANRLRCSLRAYLSVLYLHLPDYFRIMLRGHLVQPHKLVNDLRFIECIKYAPNVEGEKEVVLITTVGFLEGAPNLSIHGYNVYHKNRLILPFWPVVSSTNSKGRGVSGVLEANFIKPTHDKQDFEKSTLYYRLQSRLKEMTIEYWNYHCHLVGYPNKIVAPSQPSAVSHQTANCATFRASHTGVHLQVSRSSRAPLVATETVLHAPVHVQPPSCQNITSQAQTGSLTRRAPDFASDTGGDDNAKAMDARQNQKDVILLMQENGKLQTECLEYEKTEKELTSKVKMLKNEIEQSLQLYQHLLMELGSVGEVKIERHDW